MHVICLWRDDKPDHFHPVAGSDDLVRSGIWALTTEKAADLEGGRLYLHGSWRDPAWFVRRIEALEGPDSESNYWISARRRDPRRTVAWRGPKPTQRNYVNVVEANLRHETEGGNT